MATGAGSVIGGRFRLTELVGQGGMGRVWRGHDEFLDRDVAVKEVLLPAELSADERASLAIRTTREAKYAARLNHPGVVTIHDVVRHEGEPWIVMEYVPGRSLSALIKSNGPLPWPRVAQIGAKIADALAHAHAAGIVHRDLKPDNILLSGDRVVVTDFGIARIVDDTSRLTLSGTVLGTPHYMSPEQLEGRQVEAPADVWSLGATLYTALAGRPPFDGPTLTSVIAAILTRDPAPALQPGPLAGLVNQMLVKNPAQRPATTAIARALSSDHPGTVVIGTDDARPPRERVRDTVTVDRDRQDRRDTAAPARPRNWARAVVIGLWLTLFAGLTGIIDASLAPHPNPVETTLLDDAGYVIAMIAAAAALASARNRQVLLYFVCGSWLIALSSVVFDVLGVPDLHVFGRGGHYTAFYLLGMVSDIAGLAAVVALLAALGWPADRERWRFTRSRPAALFGALLLGEGAWRLQYVSALIGPEYYRDSFTYPSGYYAISISAVLAVLTAAAVAWYGLTLRNRVLGAALLLGWVVGESLTFFGSITSGWYFRDRTVALNVVAAIALIGGVILALGYARRRQVS